MRILWTLPYLPWPTTSGGKVRQYHLLRTLATRGHRITLLVQSKTMLTPEVEAHLLPHLERLICLPRRPLMHPKTFAGALFGSQPLLATVNGLAPRLEACFNELLHEHWDIVQIEHSYSFHPFLRTLAARRRRFILTEHNVESRLSGATYGKLPGWLTLLAQYDRWRYQRWERKVMSQAECIVAVTDSDAVVLQQLGGQPARVVVNGVDAAAFSNVSPNLANRRVLFVGNYEYAPNVDAVEWAVQEIFPRVWRKAPEVRFAVCGYAMPEQWQKKYGDSRIEWRGYIDSLTAMQSESSLFLAPLRDGGGSKLKVLEALASSLPVVSTAQGVSGLAVQRDVHYFAGEDAETLAQQIVAGLAQPERARAIGLAARAAVEKTYDWNAAAAQLEAVYKEFA